MRNEGELGTDLGSCCTATSAGSCKAHPNGAGLREGEAEPWQNTVVMSAMVKVEGLTYTWPQQQKPCLNGLNFSAEAGEKVFVVGASGSGKSTFLNLLAGILRPQRGRIFIGGTELNNLSARELDRFRARHIGLIFQQFNLIPYLDVATNIRLAVHFGAGNRLEDARVAALLEELQLDPALATRSASELSVGQQQRVAVARALVNQPRVIIADEPTSALDADSQDAFIQLLRKVSSDSGATVIFVSHDRRLSEHFDRVVELRALQSNGVGARDVAA